MTKVLQFPNERTAEYQTAGTTVYTPEMGQRKPATQIEAKLSRGGGYRIVTPLELKGRGIRFESTYTPATLTAQAQHKAGWHVYHATERAYAKLEESYSIGRESLLD